MNNIKKYGVIGLICILILVIIISTCFTSREKLYGKWYLYNGNDINLESNISEKLNSKDYIEISEGIMKTFSSDGKDGVSEMKVRGSKIHSGDAIFKYDISKIGEYKILALEVIGYDNGHTKGSVENGEKFIYVFDENINFE